MAEHEFPPNSQASKRSDTPEEKDIKQIISGKAVRKRKSLRSQFTETFIAGDLKSSIQYAALEVLLPAARDMVLETIKEGLDKLFLGEGRRYRGGATPPQAGPLGHFAYNRISQMGSRLSSPQRAISREARGRHNFDEIVLNDRGEAEQVIDHLIEVVSRYGEASISDLYALVGIQSTHTDQKWGWTNLAGAGVSRQHGGYLLDLPEPRPLD